MSHLCSHTDARNPFYLMGKCSRQKIGTLPFAIFNLSGMSRKVSFRPSKMILCECFECFVEQLPNSLRHGRAFNRFSKQYLITRVQSLPYRLSWLQQYLSQSKRMSCLFDRYCLKGDTMQSVYSAVALYVPNRRLIEYFVIYKTL